MLFYKLMWYKLPKDEKTFALNKDLTENTKIPNYTPKFDEKTLKIFTEKVNKYWFLYKNIPFVKALYISNSMSFASVNEKSDIDFFVIAKNKHIWQAKFWTSFLFWIWGLKRWKNKAGKFCVGFLVDENCLDFYSIACKPVDLYLAYWIAHLQPLYIEDKEQINNIYKENSWIKTILPNFDLKYKKILDNKIFEWKGLFKKIIEKLFSFKFIDKLLALFRIPIMKYKTKKLPNKWKDIIISHCMLKFFEPDIRQLVYLKYKSLKKNGKRKNKVYNPKNGRLFS